MKYPTKYNHFTIISMVVYLGTSKYCKKKPQSSFQTFLFNQSTNEIIQKLVLFYIENRLDYHVYFLLDVKLMYP